MEIDPPNRSREPSWLKTALQDQERPATPDARARTEAVTIAEGRRVLEVLPAIEAPPLRGTPPSIRLRDPDIAPSSKMADMCRCLTAAVTATRTAYYEPVQTTVTLRIRFRRSGSSRNI